MVVIGYKNCPEHYFAANAAWRLGELVLPVSYRVFGLHHKQAVPFSHFALSVPDGRCDHPVL